MKQCKWGKKNKISLPRDSGFLISWGFEVKVILFLTHPYSPPFVTSANDLDLYK